MQNLLSTGVFSVEGGNISGCMTSDKAVNIFKGIPYAAPPVGNLRWKAPQDVIQWDGVRDCTSWAKSAIQAKQEAFLMWSSEFIIDTTKGYSEDCLYLNIWSPNDNADNKPVIVYFHGGNFISGGSSCEVYDGENLARSGVIFVSVNFREGILGLLASSALSSENDKHVSGNYQLLDQIKALKWVRANIKAFGGNPDNITIAGQSSGAAAVNTLAVSPLAKGLFKRVFAMSHTTFHLPASNVPSKTGKGFDKVFIYEPLKHCEALGDELLGSLDAEQMRSIPADDLLKLPKQYLPYCLDSYVLDKTFHDGVIQGLTNDYDYIASFVANDYLLFPFIEAENEQDYINSARKFFGDELFSQAMAIYPPDKFPGSLAVMQQDFLSAENVLFANARSKTGNNNTWLLRFEHVMPGPESNIWGSFHSSELAYLFKHYSDLRKDYWTEADFVTGDKFFERAVNFAKTGNPGSDWERNKMYRFDADIFEPYKDFTPEKLTLWSRKYHE
ncbi:MAG: carboxylesterase family protein [Synergistaceae bacterium]|nr:carboxylesterase family protein [Synergistaceae bacterium]